MKILILGGDGMLGHRLYLGLRPEHETMVTLRSDRSTGIGKGLFKDEEAFYGVDAKRFDSILDVIAEFKPQILINAIGVIKHRKDGKEHIPSIEINALLPHKLATICKIVGARLIHFSTDCVFSGRRGSYIESDFSDAEDVYGRTKFLGEVVGENVVTLRTSIIGTELKGKTSLLEWVLSQSGRIKGYSRAIYSGITTNEMVNVIKLIIARPDVNGLYHVSSDKISKKNLIDIINDVYKIGLEVVPDDSFICDRSLDSSLFRRTTGYITPNWNAMVNEMYKEGRK